jgi:hypothetical protein
MGRVNRGKESVTKQKRIIFSVVLTLGGGCLAVAPGVQAIDFGNMMNPSKWMGGNNDRYDDYYDYGPYGPYGGYGPGWYGSPYGHGPYGGYGYGYPGYGYGYPGYPQQQQSSEPPPPPLPQ